MVVASGQIPYIYDANLPLKQNNGGWPGINPSIGPSGDLIEQGMFVLNAELRKWDFEDLDFLSYQAYTNPNLPSSGFEPKNNGQTLIGLVGQPCFLSSDNIEQMRFNLEELLSLMAEDTVYGAEDFKESWLTNAYINSPSGYSRVDSNSNLILSEFLRPPLEDIVGGNRVTTTDLHWLGGSGVFLDVDIGEVLFNPFPFPREDLRFNITTGDKLLNFGPLYPLFQKTDGTIISVNANRYRTTLGDVTFNHEVNFDAISSGKLQLDGYYLLPSSVYQLFTGNNNNCIFPGSNSFTFFTSGQRPLVGVKNDSSARIYLTPQVQNSGVYRLSISNPKTLVPNTAIPSGLVSLWPQGDPRASLSTFFTNRILGQGFSITSDNGSKWDPSISTGFHVFDDAIWLTSPNSPLSGTFRSRGLFVLSPYNGESIWYRPADLTVATSGNTFTTDTRSPKQDSPGSFATHVGLEDFNGDYIRISRSWDLNQFSASTFQYTFYFQTYNKTTLDYLEIPVTTPVQTSPALFGNTISDLMFDGTNYFIVDEFGKLARFDNFLNFIDFITIPIARRRHFAGQPLYTIGGNVTVADPILAMSPPGGSSSGIGKWSYTPSSSPTNTYGIGSHLSAKRLRAETHFGHKNEALIHDIIEVTGATHVTNGIWALLQFSSTNNLFLCRIEETIDEWIVRESIKLEATVLNLALPAVPNDFPFEIVYHPID